MLNVEQEDVIEEIPFWKEWLEVDLLNRIKLIENSLIIQEFLSEINKKDFKVKTLLKIIEDYQLKLLKPDFLQPMNFF